jgi:UTP--glucose-1-phosphate uridylyltransferase
MPNELSSAELDSLAPFGFDPLRFADFSERCSATERTNEVRGTLTPPAAADVRAPPAPESTEGRALANEGRKAIERGEVGVIVLAGGMATRFGGVVKAVVPVIDGASFLELKLRELGVHHGKVMTTVMSSFATHDRICAHAAELGARNVEVFAQEVSVRLNRDGSVFRDAAGAISPYATGHGDLTSSFRRAGLLRRFRERGGRVLLMSNVDNLGATLDPLLVGMHLARGAALTAEVVRKNRGDKGGAPARLNDRPQIIEGFRFPERFDQDSIPVFNTNTFLLDAAAIDRDFDLPFYRVEKQVEGRPVIQFERLVGELTAWLDTAFIEVPREGIESRFLPAKDPAELASRLDTIRLVQQRSASQARAA